MKMKFLNSKENTSILKISVWYIIGNFLVSGIGVLTTPVFSRLLSKTEYGQFSNFMTWESLLLVILSLQLVSTIPRAKYDYGDEIASYLVSMTVISNIMVIFFGIAVEMHPSVFVKIFNMDLRYIRILVLDLFFMPAFTLLQMKHRMYQKYKFFVLCAFVSAIARTAISIILVLFMENRLEARILGHVYPVLFMNFLIWLSIWRKGKRMQWSHCIYALPIAIPLMLNELSATILSASDRLMLTEIKGDAQNAMYTMAYTCASIAGTLWVGMTQAWSPWLYDNLHEGNTAIIRKNSKIYLGVYYCLIAGGILVVPELVLILGGQRYYEVRYVIPPILVGISCQFVYGMYVNIETYLKKTYAIAIGTAMAAALNVILNILLIPRFGYVAAAYTTLVGYLAMVIFHYLIVRGYKEYCDIYDTKFIFSIIIGIFIYHLLCMWLYSYNVIRYMLIAAYVMVLVIVAYKNKERFLKRMKRVG